MTDRPDLPVSRRPDIFVGFFLKLKKKRRIVDDA
jgi:hypothetical protein